MKDNLKQGIGTIYRPSTQTAEYGEWNKDKLIVRWCQVNNNDVVDQKIIPSISTISSSSTTAEDRVNSSKSTIHLLGRKSTSTAELNLDETIKTIQHKYDQKHERVVLQTEEQNVQLQPISITNSLSALRKLSNSTAKSCCTFNVTSIIPIQQQMYKCFTCQLSDGSMPLICSYCIKSSGSSCHSGHCFYQMSADQFGYCQCSEVHNEYGLEGLIDDYCSAKFDSSVLRVMSSRNCLIAKKKVVVTEEKEIEETEEASEAEEKSITNLKQSDTEMKLYDDIHSNDDDSLPPLEREDISMFDKLKDRIGSKSDMYEPRTSLVHSFASSSAVNVASFKPFQPSNYSSTTVSVQFMQQEMKKFKQQNERKEEMTEENKISSSVNLNEEWQVMNSDVMQLMDLFSDIEYPAAQKLLKQYSGSVERAIDAYCNQRSKMEAEGKVDEWSEDSPSSLSGNDLTELFSESSTSELFPSSIYSSSSHQIPSSFDLARSERLGRNVINRHSPTHRPRHQSSSSTIATRTLRKGDSRDNAIDLTLFDDD